LWLAPDNFLFFNLGKKKEVSAMKTITEKIEARIVTIEEQETMEGIYQLRDRVYSKEKKWASDLGTGMEKDSFDNENSRYVAVTITEDSGPPRVIGCQRIIPLQFPIMLDKDFRDLIPGMELTRKSAIEINRIAIDKRFRRQCADLLIYREVVKWSRENNIIHWYFVVEPKYLHYLNWLGIEAVQIGKEHVFPDGVKVIAAYIDLPLVLEKLKVNNPEIHQFVTNPE
jgi:N-acyl-L-homoserine lactone synthetase